MTLGLFDLPAPLLSWLDWELAAVLPAAARVALWGLVAAAFSMALYVLLSQQQRLRTVRDEAVEARRALDGFEGSFGEARPLMAVMLKTSLRQLGLVFVPAVLASLPLLFLLAWLQGTFGYDLPNGADLRLRTEPAGYQATVQQATVQQQGSTPRADPGLQEIPLLVVRDGGGHLVDQRPFKAPVTSLHKKQWWNVLIANPIGYLAVDSPVDRVEIGLQRRELLSFGPGWMRTWEFVFFTTLVAVSLVLKFAFRLV